MGQVIPPDYVQRAYGKANMMDDQQTTAELMDKLSKLPLAYQPGSTFEYGMSLIGRTNRRRTHSSLVIAAGVE